jgi:ssDNA-binding Zn-finger/Zn-ribbon topoisomerase 1
MNWKNLLKDKCPECGKNLRFMLVERIWRCNGRNEPKCEFFISDPKKNELSNEIAGVPFYLRSHGGIEPVNPDVVKAKINSKRAEPWKYNPQ